MKPNRIMVALAVCFLLTACGKDKPPVLPRPVESAKPASVESAAAGVKLDSALLTDIDTVLLPMIKRDPALTTSPQRATFT